MAAPSKPFPPSEQKLKALREQGLVVWSREFAAFSALLGFSCWHFFFGRQLAGLDSQGKTTDSVSMSWLFSSESFNSTKSPELIVMEAAELFAQLAAPVFITILALVVLGGAFQTRVLFRPSLLRFQFSRLFSLERLVTGLFGRLGNIWLPALIIGAVSYGLWLTFLMTVDELQSSYPTSAIEGADSFRGYLAKFFYPALQLALQVVLTCAFFGAVFSRFLASLRYRSEHSMTRAEVEAEAREGEVSADFKSALADIRHSAQ